MPKRVQPIITMRAMHDARDAITSRRRHPRCDDPRLEELTDDPVQMVKHVADTDIDRVGHEVVRADVLDALTLLEWARARVPALPGRYDELEHLLLEQGVAVRLPLQDMAARLGLGSKQAVHNRLLRGRIAAVGGPRREHAERDARRKAVAEAHRRKPLADWAARYGAELMQCVGNLSCYREALLEAVEALDKNDYRMLLHPDIMLDILFDQLAAIPDRGHNDYSSKIETMAGQARVLLPLLERATADDRALRRHTHLVETLGRLRLLTTAV